MLNTNKSFFTSKNNFKTGSVIISVLLVALNITRIINIPMTFDESLPRSVITMPWRDIIGFKFVTANNQILHSLARKFFVGTFSNTPFWLRVDSLLAQLLFLWYASLLCKTLFKNTVWSICVFLLLNLCPILFEFWGLSRGYGMAIAFMTGSVYYLIRYAHDKKIMFLILSLFFGILATYSVFTLVTYYCGIICFLVVKQFIPFNRTTTKITIVKEALAVLTASFLLYKLIASPIQKLIENHELYHGGDHNFVTDSMITVIRENKFPGGTPSETLLYSLAFFILISVAIEGIYWCTQWLRKGMNSNIYTGVLLWILLVAPAVAIIAQHIIYHTLYPIDRTVLFFIPLYTLSLGNWLYNIHENLPKAKFIVYFTTLLAVCNFLFNMNITTTRMWRFDANDLVVLNRIERETKGQDHKNRICVHWLLKPSLNYYIETVYASHFEEVTRINELKPGVEDTSFDYYYVHADDLGTIPKTYGLDTSFLNNEYYLFKKNNIKPDQGAMIK